MSFKSLTLESAADALKVELVKNGRYTQAVHETVVALRANRRAGTHCVKTKATVQASGSKPWKQKGTGRARAGYVSSPVWSGGGVVFGPHPRDYSKTTTKTVRRIALKKALSERIKAGDVFEVPAFQSKDGRTQGFTAWLKKNDVTGSVLLLDVKHDELVLRAAANVPRVAVLPVSDVNAEQVLQYDKVLVTTGAFEKLGERLR
jgi:large subunit ribosomal protein L4